MGLAVICFVSQLHVFYFVGNRGSTKVLLFSFKTIRVGVNQSPNHDRSNSIGKLGHGNHDVLSYTMVEF